MLVLLDWVQNLGQRQSVLKRRTDIYGGASNWSSELEVGQKAYNHVLGTDRTATRMLPILTIVPQSMPLRGSPLRFQIWPVGDAAPTGITRRTVRVCVMSITPKLSQSS